MLIDIAYFVVGLFLTGAYAAAWGEGPHPALFGVFIFWPIVLLVHAGSVFGTWMSNRGKAK